MTHDILSLKHRLGNRWQSVPETNVLIMYHICYLHYYNIPILVAVLSPNRPLWDSCVFYERVKNDLKRMRYFASTWTFLLTPQWPLPLNRYYCYDYYYFRKTTMLLLEYQYIPLALHCLVFWRPNMMCTILLFAYSYSYIIAAVVICSIF